MRRHLCKRLDLCGRTLPAKFGFGRMFWLWCRMLINPRRKRPTLSGRDPSRSRKGVPIAWVADLVDDGVFFLCDVPISVQAVPRVLLTGVTHALPLYPATVSPRGVDGFFLLWQEAVVLGDRITVPGFDSGIRTQSAGYLQKGTVQFAGAPSPAVPVSAERLAAQCTVYFDQPLVAGVLHHLEYSLTGFDMVYTVTGAIAVANTVVLTLFINGGTIPSVPKTNYTGADPSLITLSNGLPVAPFSQVTTE